MHLKISTGRWVAVMVAVLMLLSISSSVWAAPGQSHLRQTVPTRTPTKEVAIETPEPATATPEPAKPTSKPSKPQPTQAPTEAAAQPTQAAGPTEAPTQGTGAGDVAAQATATAAVIADAGYPASGGDYTSILLSGVILATLASGTAFIWLRRRARSAH